MSQRLILVSASVLPFLAAAADLGDNGFHALGTVASETATLDDAELAAIEGGEDFGDMVSGIVKGALDQANQATNKALRQANAAKHLALKLAKSGKPLAPGYRYVFVNGKLVHKEKLAGNNTIVQRISGNSTSIYSTGQSISIRSIQSNVITK
jgi:hypothetical protein